MNAATLARSAYANANLITPNAREVEYRALAQVTRQLSDHLGTSKEFPKLAEAIHLNQRLWGRLAADVADTGNGLPVQIRAQIFYLAEFTRHQSSLILKGEATPEILVEVNTAVMRGLRGTPPLPPKSADTVPYQQEGRQG